MDLGVSLPHFGKHASPQAMEKLAVEAEQMGYATLWVLERLLRPINPEHDPLRPGARINEAYATVYEPIESLTYAAAKTSRIRLGTSVIDALFHVPAVVGRRLATLDNLSGGRVIAGLGQGYMLEEFAAANVPRSRRGNGLEEFVKALRAVWAPDPVSFSGRFYKIAESNFNPKPVQPGGPKIILGGSAEAAIDRAGRIADGFNPVVQDFGVFESSLQRFEAAARAAGRDPGQLTVVVRANSAVMAENTPETRFLSGTEEKIADDLRRMDGMHVDEVFFDFNQTQMPVEDQLRAMEKLKRLTT